MDFKSMLMEMAEEQAGKMQIQATNYIDSNEFSVMLATKINERINLPWINEEREQELFEKVTDVVCDMMVGFFQKK
ncbi:MAG TPA: hypothetical protein DG048_11700 [Pseudoalteromonas sp.]|nr:hypothetical protein [Pseudoalteromonas sp.]|tara:strand:+ start:2260 stop:2487 length:228 start_codon:yes stop_codon:yes gene_type:complete